MISVLLSVQPKWCSLIAAGEKTVEVRKTMPKLETPFKVYIYCTKDEPMYRSGERFWCPNDEWGNGKVIGEFVCDKIYDITPHFDTPTFPNQYICGWNYGKEFDCLSFEELTSYLNGKNGYGWHITDLVVYDEPRELKEFKRPCDGNCQECKFALWQTNTFISESKIVGCTQKIKAPQSWCYVMENGGVIPMEKQIEEMEHLHDVITS